MSTFADVAFGAVGMLTIAVYVGLILQGAAPEQALVVAVAGGIALGMLLRIVVRLLQASEQAAPTDGEEDAAPSTQPQPEHA